MSDTIHVQKIRCYGYTGLLPEEQVLGQWFEVDLTLWVDLSRAGQSDCLEHTVDYRQAIERVQQLVRTAKYALVERLSEAIAEAILALSGVTQVRVRLTKEAPPIPDFDGQIVIDILRSRPTDGRAG